MKRFTMEDMEQIEKEMIQHPETEEERQRFLDAHRKALSLSPEERRKLREEMGKDDLLL